MIEQSDVAGGGSRTEETIPGYRFDTHSVAHNIINMTSIPPDLDLPAVGLEYREMDPFAVALFADGRRVRFHRSIERTVASIAEVNREEAVAYGRFIDVAMPVIGVMAAGIQAGDHGVRSSSCCPAPAAGAAHIAPRADAPRVRAACPVPARAREPVGI